MFTITRAKNRGQSRHGWLYSQHTFSFADYYNPDEMGFSDLRVINEDQVQSGMGFSKHPHYDMEIFSYVLSGQLEHKDSMGTGSIIEVDDVQLMSAGTGVTHSEFNHSKSKLVHFLQIWIVPNKNNLKPRYQQKKFNKRSKENQWCLILSPDGENNSLQIAQDVKVFSSILTSGHELTYQMTLGRYVYIHVVRGSFHLNGKLVQAGDGIKVRQSQSLHFSHADNAEILLFDLRGVEAQYR